MENKVLEYLESHQPERSSGWRERAEWRRANRSWLRHSQEIALAMLNRMDELKLSQTALAKRMGCSQQYVSKVLKGGENLSLETMTKIEVALGISILQPLRSNINEDATLSQVAESREKYESAKE